MESESASWGQLGGNRDSVGDVEVELDVRQSEFDRGEGNVGWAESAVLGEIRDCVDQVKRQVSGWAHQVKMVGNGEEFGAESACLRKVDNDRASG